MSLQTEHKDILESIKSVKLELNQLKDTKAPKAEQLECFKRLVTLYGLLNTQFLLESVESKIA